METGVIHAFNEDRIISPSHECASRKNHAMIEIFDAEFAMQRVIDFHSQLIDSLFINRLIHESINVVLGGLKFVRHVERLAVEVRPYLFSVIHDSDDDVVSSANNIAIPFNLSLQCRRVDCDTVVCLRFQYNRRKSSIARQVPSIGLECSAFAIESKLFQCGDLSDSSLCDRGINLVETKHFSCVFAHFIFCCGVCGHSRLLSRLTKRRVSLDLGRWVRAG